MKDKYYKYCVECRRCKVCKVNLEGYYKQVRDHHKNLLKIGNMLGVDETSLSYNVINILDDVLRHIRLFRSLDFD